MSTLFRKGKRGVWIVRYRDADGRRRDVSTGTTDRRTAERAAAEIERTVALRRAGLLDPAGERRAAHDKQSIERHLAAFEATLRGRGVTAHHVRTTTRCARAVLVGAGCDRLSALSPASVQQFLGGLRKAGKSSRTANTYLVAAKAFARWAVHDGRLAADPLVTLSRFNEATDRRRRRRALTASESLRLLAAADDGPTVHGMSGLDRAMLYRLALGTGFRAAELAALRRKDFALSTNPPTITVPAAYSKHRREDVQPIRRDLAALLSPWIARRGDPIFPRGALARAGELVAADLRAAGIEVETDAGIADFHALRHTYITNLVRSGASVKEAQTLARHATPDMTLRVYAHASIHDTAQALENLPTNLPTGPAESGDSERHETTRRAQRRSAKRRA